MRLVCAKCLQSNRNAAHPMRLVEHRDGKKTVTEIAPGYDWIAIRPWVLAANEPETYSIMDLNMYEFCPAAITAVRNMLLCAAHVGELRL